jgi:peroxiredoxin
MKALHRDRKDIAIVAVNIAVNDSERRARRYRDHFQLPFPVIYDEKQAIVQSYRVLGTPTAVIIGRDGVIRYVGTTPIRRRDRAAGFTPCAESSDLETPSYR